jgi:hypothetical protein
LKLLFERIAVPMARAGTRGAWFRGLRVMAVDGVVFDVPDTAANDEEFGRGGNDQGTGPFPQVRLVAVAECGTHALVDAVLGPVATGEQTLAAALISRLTAGMLVLADRNFYSYQAWQQASATGAQLLWRVSGRLPLPVLAALPDGSYQSLLINPKIRGRRREMLLIAATAGEHLEPTQATLIRVIEYTIEDRPGSGNCSASSPRSPTPSSHPRSTSPPPTTNAGKSNCLSTRSKPTKQVTSECCARAPQNWSNKRSGHSCSPTTRYATS